MDEQTQYIVVNWINIKDNVILVGATDNERWNWDTLEGMSGADAKTIVCVTLTDNGEQFSISEEASFHCSPGDATRTVAMSHLAELFEIAWDIKTENLNFQAAQKKYFGKKIKKARNNL